MGSPASRTRYATKGLSGGAGTDKGEKLVGGGSHRDHRCGDCCGHAAVKSGWWDIRCGYTEEQGRFLYTEGDREGWAQTTTAILRDGRLFQSINPQRTTAQYSVPLTHASPRGDRRRQASKPKTTGLQSGGWLLGSNSLLPQAWRARASTHSPVSPLRYREKLQPITARRFPADPRWLKSTCLAYIFPQADTSHSRVRRRGCRWLLGATPPLGLCHQSQTPKCVPRCRVQSLSPCVSSLACESSRNGVKRYPDAIRHTSICLRCCGHCEEFSLTDQRARSSPSVHGK